MTLAACSTDETPAPPAAAPIAVPPASEPPAATAQATPLPGASSEAKFEVFPGTGAFTQAGRAREPSRTTVGEQGDITLNFINTDVKDVAKAVLGDYLKLNYEIGANVQGSVTIQTSQPLQRSQVLPALEQALRLNGLTVVESHGIYKVLALADAPRMARINQAGSRGSANIGYGIDIVPVHYVGAAEMQKLLEPLAPTAGIVHVDAARNVLIVEGTAEERQTLRDDIALFDADWMSGMSFAIITPSYTDAEELTKELNQVMGGLNSPVGGLVQLIPIQRLNAVLAISHQTKYLEHLRAWVNRLDRPGQGSDKRIFIYNVQNGRASDLAATLGKLLFGSSGVSGSASPRPSFAGTTTASSPTETTPSGLDKSGGATTSAVPSSGGAEGVSVSGSAPGIGSLSITADETNNALAILASPQQYGVIETALRKLDAAPLQVLLEAAIAEVTLTNDLKYGVQYFWKDSHNQTVLSDTGSTSVVPSLPGFAYMFSNGSNINVVLSALEQVTHVEVVSSPELMVLNNQTATLQVGDRVPIITEQAVSTQTADAPIVNSVQYEDTGVILKVTPRVNRGGMVMMDISQEVSGVSDTSASPVPSPTIQQRKITSSVAVQDGETIVLGGLISDSRTQSKNGVPYLQDIPVLGNLFRDTGNNSRRTELMVLITPHVVDDIKKARKVTDELRRKLPAVQSVLERAR
ncbi:MAG: type II secretion system secretin GspD [Alphaproteobacteria bacterium]|nr:type II secretion system secretin GspD [Alphaproteobacteria bacterium]